MLAPLKKTYINVFFCTLLMSAPPPFIPNAFGEELTKKTMLVLDASGSMWGQIDGVTKIEIARFAIEDFLHNFSENNHLGLIAYGHNREGDCSDIETIIAPAAGMKNNILSSIKHINPKGKTPLSASVIHAADALGYKKNASTVILISDGKETCGLDPCEVGTNLKARGINFKAHVIGFDVKEVSDQEQLKCLAHNTGGYFYNASDSLELAEALNKAAKAAEELHPLVFETIFSAIEKESGALIYKGLEWTIENQETGEIIIKNTPSNGPSLVLKEGKYKVIVTRTKDGVFNEKLIEINKASPTKYILELPTPLPEATVTVPNSIIAGSTIAVEWTGPNNPEDYIQIIKPDKSFLQNRTGTSEGSPLNLEIPSETGRYEVNYVLGSTHRVLVSQPISVTEPAASLAIPLTAMAGATIAVEWTGPNNPRDYIQIVNTDDPFLQNRTDTSEGSPLNLQVLTEAGRYEVNYVLGANHTILTKKELTVTPVSATLEAPQSVKPGSLFDIVWTGPGYKRDRLVIVKSGSNRIVKSASWIAKKGSPTQIKAPKTPGNYEILYQINSRKHKTIARRPLLVQ